MRRVLASAAVVALLMIGAAAPAGARPNQIEVSGGGFTIEEIDPGETWFRGDVLHVRDVVWRVRVVGSGPNADYMTGEQISTFGFNWNYKTGAVSAFGSIDVELDAFDGGYRASFHVAGPPNSDAIGGTCAEFPFFRAVGQGYGELDGAQARWDSTSNTCGYTFSSDLTVFFPGPTS